MARINHTVDRELAAKGLLRISVVAKALKLAPKTVNAWTAYPISKIGGVKYLTWEHVFADKKGDCDLFNLAADAKLVHAQVTNTKISPAVKVVSVLEKAKALLPKKVIIPEPVKEAPIKMQMPQELVEQIEAMPPVLSTIVPEEILVPLANEEAILTIPDDYKHLLRK